MRETTQFVASGFNFEGKNNILSSKEKFKLRYWNEEDFIHEC